MSRLSLKDEIIEELGKLSTHEHGLVYKFIRTKLIANIEGVSLSNGGELNFTSNYSDYIKCADEVLRIINYSKDSSHGHRIIECIKRHFA